MKAQPGIQYHRPGRLFSIPEGTCFIDVDLPCIGDSDTETEKKNNNHRFVVVNEEEDYVDVVMTSTLEDKKEHKDRTHLKYFLSGFFQMTNPTPPIYVEEERSLYTDASQVMLIPKSVLYDSRSLWICNQGGTKMNSDSLETLKSSVRTCASFPTAIHTDPFHYRDNPEAYSLDRYIDTETNYEYFG